MLKRQVSLSAVYYNYIQSRNDPDFKPLSLSFSVYSWNTQHVENMPRTKRIRQKNFAFPLTPAKSDRLQEGALHRSIPATSLCGRAIAPWPRWPDRTGDAETSVVWGRGRSGLERKKHALSRTFNSPSRSLEHKPKLIKHIATRLTGVLAIAKQSYEVHCSSSVISLSLSLASRLPMYGCCSPSTHNLCLVPSLSLLGPACRLTHKKKHSLNLPDVFLRLVSPNVNLNSARSQLRAWQVNFEAWVDTIWLTSCNRPERASREERRAPAFFVFLLLLFVHRRWYGGVFRKMIRLHIL